MYTACTHMDIIYREGQQIQPNCSTHCTCINGEFECENVLCSVDGATCVASGDPHYQTFDMQFYDFQGDCEYVLTTPCDSDEFIITVQNSAHNEFVSCTDQVNITTANTEIILGRGEHITINGEDMMQTYDGVVTATSEVQVLRVAGNTHVILLTHNIRIFWDGLYRVEVTVSTTWQNRLCGLCGNYNGNGTDDFITPNGTQVTVVDEFGSSWVSGNSSNCGLLTTPFFCLGDTRTFAQNRCNQLLGNIFEPCHRVVDPTPFQENCMFDYCNCNDGDREECYCESLKTYASACSNAGVVIPDWKDVYCRKLSYALAQTALYLSII